MHGGEVEMLWIGAGIAAGCGAWAWFAWWCSRLGDSPRPGDVFAGMFFGVMKCVARRQRLRVEGLEHVPRGVRKDDGSTAEGADAAEGWGEVVGPLVVVVNHTAGVDPLLVQVALRFEVRWMMAKDMMVAALNPLWKWIGLIGVDRLSPRGDPAALREALSHLDERGVVGIFPEGAIFRGGMRGPRAGDAAAREGDAQATDGEDGARARGGSERALLGTFAPGVGLLILKSGAPVLQGVITGTPRNCTVWASVLARAKGRKGEGGTGGSGGACVRFLPLKRYVRGEMTAAEVAADLEARCRRELGRSGTEASGHRGNEGVGDA